jgi:hypothetical protein
VTERVNMELKLKVKLKHKLAVIPANFRGRFVGAHGVCPLTRERVENRDQRTELRLKGCLLSSTISQVWTK